VGDKRTILVSRLIAALAACEFREVRLPTGGTGKGTVCFFRNASALEPGLARAAMFK